MSARILVVEDNDDNIELMAYLLRARGHEPLLARDGAEGLRVAAEERPSLILMDVQLPGLDGLEAMRRLRRSAELAPTPVIAVTALAMAGDRERLLEAGFDGYLAKPIAPASFVDEVEARLAPGDPGEGGAP